MCLALVLFTWHTQAPSHIQSDRSWLFPELRWYSPHEELVTTSQWRSILDNILLKHFPITQFIHDAHFLRMTGRFSSHNVIGGSIRWQPWHTRVPGSTLWFLLFLHVLYCHDGSYVDTHSACHRCIRMIIHLSENFDYLMHLQIMYLIVSITYKHKTVPLISLIMIGVVYGLQALVFMLCCKWDMVFYILAILIFSFMFPIYPFWHMGNFSLGATRVVLGKSGKKFIIHVSAFFCEMFHDWFIQDEG